MNKYLWLSLGIFLLATGVQANDRFVDLRFLEGCWKGEAQSTIVYESWGNSDGNTMLGASKTISKSQLESFEFLSLVLEKDNILYIPYVNGKKSVSFPAKQITANSAEFSNPAHDFPKSIRYERRDNTLHISLSGDGPAIAYQLKSVACNR